MGDVQKPQQLISARAFCLKLGLCRHNTIVISPALEDLTHLPFVEVHKGKPSKRKRKRKVIQLLSG
jgi:hypothetical protein